MGLFAAPFAALIGLLVVSHQVQGDKSHAYGVYGDLLVVLLALSLAMLAFAWFRKRLFLGIVMALYGLTVFNLKYWGFGFPFLLGGAWLLVRAYRAQRAVREAGGDAPGGGNTAQRNGNGRTTPNKRYTPPSGSKRSSPRDSGKDPRAG